MIRREDVYPIGRLTRTHGLKGEINFQFTDDVWDRVEADYLICDVDGILVPFFMEEYRFRSDTTAIVKFEDLDSADAVQFLVNSDVYMETKYQEELGEDEVSLNYFIGFKMIDGDDGQEIGTIVDVDDKTENWLFIVERRDGQEVMIPAHEEFISDINKEEKTMVMDLPLGLLDL
ncbi:MAG: 16S rRNA processing protein RimM [Bacteroidaceae bacterium]|jgi:16S rRNA processing protein RimM|nr:16S rRNA processing protein RimM [Bacteroidaceae bacterium]